MNFFDDDKLSDWKITIIALGAILIITGHSYFGFLFGLIAFSNPILRNIRSLKAKFKILNKKIDKIKALENELAVIPDVEELKDVIATKKELLNKLKHDEDYKKFNSFFNLFLDVVYVVYSDKHKNLFQNLTEDIIKSYEIVATNEFKNEKIKFIEYKEFDKIIAKMKELENTIVSEDIKDKFKHAIKVIEYKDALNNYDGDKLKFIDLYTIK